MRLDIYLSCRFPEFSRSFLQKFIRRIGIKVNGKLIKKPHAGICENDYFAITHKELQTFIAAKSKQNAAASTALKNALLYSGKTFFVIDKAPYTTTEKITHGFFSVHRLDKDTSGVLVIAKDEKTCDTLQQQWQEKTVKKTYIALVKGEIHPSLGAIEGSIFRSLRNRKKMAISRTTKARKAYTEYRVIRYLSHSALTPIACTLLYIFPKTGRTHQIRVHFAAIGYPVIGDSTYGDKNLNKKFEQLFGLKRQFLHAAKLALTHPATKKRVTFTAKLPEDLEEVLKKLA